MRNNYKKLQSFTFEIYTKNPDTGEGGWDIQYVVGIGETRKEAVEVLKSSVPNFDCVITATASFNGMPLTKDEKEIVKFGARWYWVRSALVG